jgi:hypothetical protein
MRATVNCIGWHLLCCLNYSICSPNQKYFAVVMKLSEQFRERLLILVLLVIRTFSGYDGTQDTIVAECFADSYDTWMSLFVSGLQVSITIHTNMKRYFLKVQSSIIQSLTLIFRDMLRYSGRSLQGSLLPVWEFCYRVCPLYLWTTVFGYSMSCYETRTEKRDQPLNGPTPRSLLDYQYLSEDGDENYENDVDALAHQVL